jgi:hypothetical protein
MAKKKSIKGQRSSKGEPGSEQDVKRRLGDFTGKGEHARRGGRTGIIGQSPKKFKTDRKK